MFNQLLNKARTQPQRLIFANQKRDIKTFISKRVTAGYGGVGVGSTKRFMMLASGLTASSIAAYSLTKNNETNQRISSSLLFPSTLASALAHQSTNIKKVKLGDLLKSDNNLLKAGSKNKTTIAVFYDSRVGTHSEYLSILGVK